MQQTLPDLVRDQDLWVHGHCFGWV